MKELKQKIRDFLNELSENRAYFFNSEIFEHALLGSINGQLICVFVLGHHRFLTNKEAKFKNHIVQAGGEFYIFNTLEDACYVAKQRGWHD